MVKVTSASAQHQRYLAHLQPQHESQSDQSQGSAAVASRVAVIIAVL